VSIKHTTEYIQQITVAIDKKIAAQLNVILHHKRLQQLEASWRGLYYLTGQVSEQDVKRIKFKMLNISWLELTKDLARCVEFDQSQLFLKVYSHEFGQPGGEPFGLLLGDYAISHRCTHLVNDLETLRSIGKVAAAAFAPFISAISPHFLGLDDFNGLERRIEFERTFQQAEYQVWKAVRQDEDARFLGLLLPNVLMRLPYNRENTRYHPFYFEEEINQHAHYLWGSPAYCFAAVAARAFAQTGWFSDVRGLPADTYGGRATHLPVAKFHMDGSFLANKAPVNAYITDQQEKNLTNYGFITLSTNEKTGSAAFYECHSLQKPKIYDQHNATQNSQLSGMLHYVLCVSRFAHYLKVIARETIGTFGTAQECENHLQDWIRQYTAASADLSNELKIKYPLREAKVQVHERIGTAGSYLCTIHLSPHYQFDQIQTWLKLKTELSRSL